MGAQGIEPSLLSLQVFESLPLRARLPGGFRQASHEGAGEAGEASTTMLVLPLRVVTGARATESFTLAASAGSLRKAARPTVAP